MTQLTLFVALVAFGVANAGVVNYGLPAATLLGAPYGLSGINSLGAASLLASAGLVSHGIAAPGLLAVPGVYGLGSGAILSNPGGLAASAVPGVNAGPDGAGPSTGSALAGPTAVLHGSSATLIASTGVVKGHAKAGANIPSAGIAVAPSAAGANVPAAAKAILKPGPVAAVPLAASCPWC